MELSNHQYRLLKQLSRKNLKSSELSQKSKKEISFLGKNGYIEYEGIFDNENPIHQTDSYVHITPKGEAEYQAYIRQRNRWLIPLVISLAALIVSIFALYKSSQPIEIHIDTNAINTATAANAPENSEK